MPAEPGPSTKKKRLEDEETANSLSHDNASTSSQSEALDNRWMYIQCHVSLFHWFGLLPLQVVTFVESAIPKLRDLQKELYPRVANDWEDIGIQLDIEEGKLKRIKSDNAGDSKACLREMLRTWLSRVDPPPSWSAITEALDTLGHEFTAEHLRDKYCVL